MFNIRFPKDLYYYIITQAKRSDMSPVAFIMKILKDAMAKDTDYVAPTYEERLAHEQASLDKANERVKAAQAKAKSKAKGKAHRPTVMYKKHHHIVK